MNKDAILATLIGLVLGLTIAGIFIFGPTILKALPNVSLPKVTLPQTAPQSSPAPSPEPKAFGVTITAPLPDAVEPKEEVVVSGMTEAGVTVVIQGPHDEDVILAGADGAYAGKITAVEGKNDITVTAYGSDSRQTQSSVTVYYTEEEF